MEFDVSDEGLDFIYNLLLEREVPLTTEEMSAALVEFCLERLEKEAQEAVDLDYMIYLPLAGYEVGQKILFPALGNAVGSVVGVRDGDNPEISSFDVIKVEFEETGQQKEFAARLVDHVLNNPPEPELDEEELNSVEGVISRYGRLIEDRLIKRLERAEDIVRIAGSWFPKALLADIHEGHLNLAEAVLDVAGGGPLPTSNLLEHIELPSGIDPLLMAFSLDYALQEDDRFDEVGPAGQVLWYLKRLEPPEVLLPPPRLEPVTTPVDRTVLTEDLIALERSLDDELSPLEPLEGALEDVTISLLYPHWRVGALPLSYRLKPMFPTAYEAPRIRFILVDGHSGDEFPGWVVRQAGYVMGLEDWYKRYDVPTGGLVRIRRGKEEGKVIVETKDRSRRNDWIRTVTISEEGVVGFTMLKQSIGTAYDDRMVVGVIDPVALDEAWLRGKQRQMPIDRLVAQIFRELAKLTPQSAVHAQSLYSGLNVIQRLPPATVFAELVTQPYYVHVGDLYWRFESSAWSQA
ncbi:MAG TPA: hypothetical protein G4O11_02565 [Anaerolineae bacterium]|nr:MAG: hypothetical protein AMJ88_16080 [Anaerolineae bacterium SM23_ 63]HEY42844.1 hypothetical protein [Anaerolineae bacterium]